MSEEKKIEIKQDQTKQCSKCKQQKSLDEFRLIHTHKKTYRMGRCKACYNEYTKIKMREYNGYKPRIDKDIEYNEYKNIIREALKDSKSMHALHLETKKPFHKLLMYKRRLVAEMLETESG